MEAAPRVQRYLGRRAGFEIAEELTAEVFALAWAARDRYDPAVGDAVGWLFGFVINVARRQARTGGRRQRAYGRLSADQASVDHAEAVAGRLDNAQRLERTAAALDHLSRMDRDVILLRAWGELSYEQIGDALGLDTTVVKTRLSRARRRLAAQMDEGGDP